LVRHAGFRKLSFADALRREVCEAFGVEPMVCTRRELKDAPLAELAMRHGPMDFVAAVTKARGGAAALGDLDTFLDLPRTPRQIMQWWGTEFRREQDPDYWVDQVAHHLADYEDFPRWVITDVRFDNEAHLVRRLGGQVWQVWRTGFTAGTTTEGSHASATDGRQFNPERTISNTRSLDDLRREVLQSWWALDAGLHQVHVASIVTTEEAAA
jgi:hypothetical protein